MHVDAEQAYYFVAVFPIICYICIDKRLIVCTDAYTIPLFLGTLINNLVQIVTSVKCLFYDKSNTTAYGDGCQPGTRFKCPISDGSNTIGDGGYIEMMRCHLIEILVLSLRSIYVAPRNRRHMAVQKVAEYVDEHYSEHINLSSLCKEMNFSLPYISMRFREDMGISFQKYLQKVRIEHSCRLLAETDEKITHIAHNVGYDDIKFFGKIFKQTMNMSPREYRRMTRQG